MFTALYHNFGHASLGAGEEYVHLDEDACLKGVTIRKISVLGSFNLIKVAR